MEPKGDLELYEKAKELAKEAWAKSYNQKNGKGFGYLLQALFKRKDVWTLKDLNNEQLKELTTLAEKRLAKKSQKNYEQQQTKNKNI